MAIRGTSSERFGNLPLPIEMDSVATEGELMVGRPTGHIYVRNGGKNVSKTVEIEEFLKALRMGALNWVRQGGNFDPNLYKNNWVLNANASMNITDDRLSLVTEDDRTFLRIQGYTSAETSLKQWYMGTNLLYTYHKAKFIVGKMITLSFMVKTNVPDASILILLADSSSTNEIIESTRIKTTPGWTKVEITKPIRNVGNKPVIMFHIETPDVILDIDEVQLEPGDRSFAWRPSFYDMISLMEFKDNTLKLDLENKITNAIKECKDYTDDEITKLGDKFKTMVDNAIITCKNYTDTEITKVNTRITNEVSELEQKDRMGRAHLILGNNDWTKYINILNNSTAIPLLSYNADERGVMIHAKDSPAWIDLGKDIPIFENTKYYVRVKVKQLEGTGTFYCGVKSLGKNLEPITTDKATAYNYGLAAGVRLENGQEYEYAGFFEGYNELEGTNYNKFDPYAHFFRVMFVTNFSGTGKTVIKGVEIFEVPKCLHNALSVASPAKDGLMSIEEHNKLETVEWNANNYKHPTGDGNMHVPATGTTSDRKVLTAGKTAGSAAWEVLPDTIDKVDGKHANEFVWINEQKVDVGGKSLYKLNHPYKNLLNISGISTGYVKIDLPIPTTSSYFNIIKLTIYSQTGGYAHVEAGFYSNSDALFSSIYAFSSNRDITGPTLFLKSENGKVSLYIGRPVEFRNAMLSIDEYLYYWSGAVQNHLDWNSTIVATLPSGVTQSSYNNQLNANFLNNRTSDTYADKQGAKVDTYTTPTPDKKVANMNTRSNNENSWLLIDPTTDANSNYGVYHNGSSQPVSVPGEVDLPPDSLGVIANNKLQHYHDLRTGDTYHKGNLVSHNIQLGNFRIIKNDSKKSLDFILD